MANKYWVGGTGTWTQTGTTHWSNSSGGASGASAPAAGDSVFFDSASSSGSYTVTQDSTVQNVYQFANVTFNAPSSGTLSYTGAPYLFIGGNVNIAASGVAFSNMYLYFGGTSTLTTNGVAVDYIYMDGGSSSLTLNGALTSTVLIVIYSGIFNTGNNNITTGQFSSPNASQPALTLNLGSSIITVTGSTVNMSNPLLTVTSNTATINMTSASSKTFTGGGYSWYKLNNGGAGGLNVVGGNTFDTISNTAQPTSFVFTAGTTTTITNWGVNGTAGNLVTIGSATAASHTLSKSSGNVSANYLSISRSTATGGATWYAGANSTDGGNNSGWIFSSAPSPSTGFLGLLLRIR